MNNYKLEIAFDLLETDLDLLVEVIASTFGQAGLVYARHGHCRWDYDFEAPQMSEAGQIVADKLKALPSTLSIEYYMVTLEASSR